MTKSSGKIQMSLTLLEGKRGEKRELNLQGRIEQQRGLDDVIENHKRKCTCSEQQSAYSFSNRISFKQHKNISLGVNN